MNKSIQSERGAKKMLDFPRKIKKALQAAAVFRALRNMPPQTPEGIVDFVMSTPLIRPLQVQSELLRFAQIVADLNPLHVLEIGTCLGGTLCVLTRLAAPCASIISVDLPRGSFGGGYDFLRAQIFRQFPVNGQRLYLLKADSNKIETKARVLECLNGSKLDVLLIDGDHTYQGVSKDYSLYAPLVRDGGVIAFHDIAPHLDPACEVPQFWEEIKPPNAVEFIENRSQGWAGIGVIANWQCNEPDHILP